MAHHQTDSRDRSTEDAFLYARRRRPRRRGVSWALYPGETLGVVGESGCGKSITALSVLRLIARPGRIVEGEIRLAGRNLIALSEAEMRSIRGNEISMIFQEPMTSLNPVLTVGRQIAETLILHQDLSRSAARDKAVEMLRLVRISEAERRVDEYPFQLSGGMRQRVMIAMALSCKPESASRRRADDGARRHDPGTDSAPHARSEGAARHGDHPHHPRPRCHRRDRSGGWSSCMPDARSRRPRSRRCSSAAPPLYARPHEIGAAPRQDGLDVERGAGSRKFPGMVPALRKIPAGCIFAPRCAFCRGALPPRETTPRRARARALVGMLGTGACRRGSSP